VEDNYHDALKAQPRQRKAIERLGIVILMMVHVILSNPPLEEGMTSNTRKSMGGFEVRNFKGA